MKMFKIAALSLLSLLQPLAHAQLNTSADEGYLDRLRGEWRMSGRLRGKPVSYHARGERVLGGGFLRLQLLDAESPPEYEAQLFIGYDPKASDFVAHWLDRYGATGARVVATGKRDGERLVLYFPYTDGAFRDTFDYQPGTDRWTLLLESQGKDGSWSEFARYSLFKTH